MIVAQERGTKFTEKAYLPGGWEPADGEDSASKAGAAWDDLEASLGIERLLYGVVLNKEGKAFRQRFIDYVPPED